MVQTHSFTLAAAALASLAGLAQGAGVDEWRSRSIYQVMTDRFALTDGSTDAPCVLWEYCNGTWAGLINHLDYIQGMGFTAIQISPVVKNIEGDTGEGTAYHGFWTQDDYAVNEHFGTADELKNLADELHKRDMFLLVDVVVNNFAQAFNNTIPPPVNYSKFDPLDNQEYFHPYCNVTEWTNATNYQDCWLYPYAVALADVKTESQVVVDMLGQWINELVSNYSIDGLRIDAAKHVNDAFLPAFVDHAGVFALGEVLTGVTEDMCRYQELDLLPGMPNYLDYYPIMSVFNGGAMTELAIQRQNSTKYCNDTTALGTFYENHDMPRFASVIPDLTLAKNAMTYVILNDGIPLVYYGQEQHFNGNGTPFNREPMWPTQYNTSAPLYNLTAQLNGLRNLAINQSSDYVTTLSEQIYTDVNHLVLRKGVDGKQVVFIINNLSSTGPSYNLSVAGFEPNQEVVEILSCTNTTTDGTGNVTAFMGAGEPKVFYPAAALKGTKICPVTTEAKPIPASNSTKSAASVVAGRGVAALSTLGATVVLASMAWLL